MMERVRSDAEALVAPGQKPVGSGVHHRPCVEYPDLPKCPLSFPDLPASGSYPSGHATLGWLWGSILAEIAPEFADQLIARAIAFGDSRIVCGFHYPSDVAAGRLAAAALLDRLHADAGFQKDLAVAKKELTALRRRVPRAHRRKGPSPGHAGERRQEATRIPASTKCDPPLPTRPSSTHPRGGLFSRGLAGACRFS